MLSRSNVPILLNKSALCSLAIIDVYLSLLLLRIVKVPLPKGDTNNHFVIIDHVVVLCQPTYTDDYVELPSSTGIKSILNGWFRIFSIQSLMIVSTSMFFPLAISIEYLVSTVDGTTPLKGLNSAEVRLLSTRKSPSSLGYNPIRVISSLHSRILQSVITMTTGSMIRFLSQGYDVSIC
ncbi:hypothetical protein Tco_0974384 [Tanacetum coccineum]|uniref:Uncharacterized protein n=1 Tax=Tanacetum coccineum TaxID=301880 RepID=A0ABQ5EBK5_9ASTR